MYCHIHIAPSLEGSSKSTVTVLNGILPAKAIVLCVCMSHFTVYTHV